MERSAIHLLAKRGKSIRQIAAELGRNRRTVARVLREPLDRQPAPRARRRSIVDPFRPQIAAWLADGLTAVRMLELARADPAHPYTGSRSVFGDMVRRIRRDLDHDRAVNDVPIGFQGLPGEYLQVDWGEVTRFPFTARPPGTRYFLACRLKHSRWMWVQFTTTMRQEVLFRGLVDCFVALGWVPWVLVFDNMRTVTSGRDAANQPIWTPALLQLAAEFGFHPQACDPGAANQKGTVENLVKFVKGNFLLGRSFADDVDLDLQRADWQTAVNTRICAATGVPPLTRLPHEAARGGALPPTAQDYGLHRLGRVSRESLVPAAGNRYSVPIVHVGAPVTIRLHRERVRIWRDTTLLADHPRAPNGAQQRIVDPAHFAPLFARKPRAQAMLYRDQLLTLAEPVPTFVAELSRRHRARLTDELRALYALYERVGAAALSAAMTSAMTVDCYSVAALTVVLGPAALPAAAPSGWHLPGVPTQAEVDRALAVYEQWVAVDVALEEVHG